MPDQKYDKITLVGLHEPDYSMEPNQDGGRDRVGLPGLYSVGFLAGDRFVKVATVKAGDLVDGENKVQLGKKPTSTSSDDSSDDSADS